MKKLSWILLAAAILSGCVPPGGKQQSVVGTWVDDDPQDKGTTYIFETEGSGKITSTQKISTGEVVPCTTAITYGLDSGKLTIHETSITLTVPDDAPINVKTEIAEGNKAHSTPSKDMPDK